MASTYSFDIVSEVDLQEADNAVNQANKEAAHRYDLRGSNQDMEFDRGKRTITIRADGEHFVTAIREILVNKMIKRGISVEALDEQKIELLGGKHVRQVIGLRSGLSKDDAKKITTLIKDGKFKVTAQIQDEKVRVTGKSKDDLQAVMNAVRAAQLGFPVQFENLR
jgi:cyclic-di-GMP-binding protein